MSNETAHHHHRCERDNAAAAVRMVQFLSKLTTRPEMAAENLDPEIEDLKVLVGLGQVPTGDQEHYRVHACGQRAGDEQIECPLEAEAERRRRP